MAFRTITKVLEDGCVLTVKGVPVYRCEDCGRETMNMRVRTLVENEAQRFVDETGGPGVECQLSIRLEPVPEEAPFDGALRDDAAYSLALV